MGWIRQDIKTNVTIGRCLRVRPWIVWATGVLAYMGAVFDRAFRQFAEAFEKRAEIVYGKAPSA